MDRFFVNTTIFPKKLLPWTIQGASPQADSITPQITSFEG